MQEIILMKASSTALDQNPSHEQDKSNGNFKLHGTITAINKNGTLLFSTQTMGDIIIANPGNLSLGDSVTIELDKENLATIGKVISINSNEVKNTPSAQNNIISAQAPKDIVETHALENSNLKITAQLEQINTKVYSILSNVPQIEQGASIQLSLLPVATTDNFTTKNILNSLSATRLTESLIIKTTDPLPKHINLEAEYDIKLRLIQKFIESNFEPETFAANIKDSKQLLDTSLLPGKIITENYQKILVTPIGRFIIPYEINIKQELVLVKILDTTPAPNLHTQESELFTRVSNNLLSILPAIKQLKKELPYNSKYLDKVLEVLKTSNQSNPTKEILAFLGLINVEIESDSDQEKSKHQIQNLKEVIDLIRNDTNNSEDIIIKQDTWINIPLHLNGKIIDDETKCYVRKKQGNILRFFIYIHFAQIQLDGMIKISAMSKQIEEFNLTIHSKKTDNELSNHIRNIFNQTIQKHALKGAIDFDTNLAKITHQSRESFSQLVV